MSASRSEGTSWPDGGFWSSLEQLEQRQRRASCAHEEARRGLEQLSRFQGAELRIAWQRYCEVLGELEQLGAHFEALRR